MITPIENLPGKIIGFKASGEITAREYETVVYPAIESRLKNHRMLRLLWQCGEDFEKFDWGAIWDDTLLGFKHYLTWEKIALVSDLTWLNAILKTLCVILPCEIRTYKNKQFEEAIRWLNQN